MEFYSNNFEINLLDEFITNIRNVILSGDFILGEPVSDLESVIAKKLGKKHAIAVGSGTDALNICLRSLQLPAGSEVITTPFTFFAATEAILSSGLKVKFCDIEPNTFNLDITQLRKLITKDTKAILPVHMFGNPCDMENIMELANEYGLYVIEDCAQAFGANFGGKKVGTFGDFGCYSFYPTKNLGAYGDGGMIVTDDDEMAQYCRVYRNQGAEEPYYHDYCGRNSRFDSIQASILLTKIGHVDRWNEMRRKNAEIYINRLSDVEAISLPEVNNGHVFHQFTIRISNRQKLKDYLNSHGIPTMIYYPLGIHNQRALLDCDYDFNSDLPNTDQVTKEVLSLPIYPGITEREINLICDKILEFINQ